MRGKFIVVEGIRGSGKSTLIKEGMMHATFTPVEDFGTLPPCEELGKMFLNDALPWSARLGLAFTSKAILQEKMIRPLLEAGEDVVCERWVPSVEAHLLYPGDLSNDLAEQASEMFGLLEPDLTIICTVDLEVAQERLQKASRRLNFLEKRGVEFMAKVCHYYNTLCDGIPADEDETRLDLLLRGLEVRT